ncbi:hypothetical protein BT93_B3008 [Corymbia citriodora subsp. variegata]|nr:hypothetical protein BT93_B3008 [Corymbia citriodora subsp. variegata]
MALEILGCRLNDDRAIEMLSSDIAVTAQLQLPTSLYVKKMRAHDLLSKHVSIKPVKSWHSQNLIGFSAVPITSGNYLLLECLVQKMVKYLVIHIQIRS